MSLESYIKYKIYWALRWIKFSNALDFVLSCNKYNVI
jgi:hypothetical protein